MLSWMVVTTNQTTWYHNREQWFQTNESQTRGGRSVISWGLLCRYRCLKNPYNLAANDWFLLLSSDLLLLWWIKYEFTYFGFWYYNTFFLYVFVQLTEHIRTTIYTWIVCKVSLGLEEEPTLYKFGNYWTRIPQFEILHINMYLSIHTYIYIRGLGFFSTSDGL